MHLRILLPWMLVALVVGCGRNGTAARPVSPKDDTVSRGVGEKDTTEKAPSEPASGQKTAVVIGVRVYDHQKLTELKYTENDAEELSAVLRKAGYEVVVLTTTRGEKNRADIPSAGNIRAALNRLSKGRKRGDSVLVALSGHGVQLSVKDPEAKGPDRVFPCFCPSDAQLNDTDYQTGKSPTLINLNDLIKQVGDCGAGSKLLLVDACRDEVEARNLEVDQRVVPSGFAAMFSCKSGERAFETRKLGNGHGIFFYHVIQGLKGEAKNRNGSVTWGSLAEHVTEKVMSDVPRVIGGGAKQTPHEFKNLQGLSPVLIPPADGENDRGYREAMKSASAAMKEKKFAEAVKAYTLALTNKPGDADAVAGEKAAEAALKQVPEPDKDRVAKEKGKGDSKRWKVIAPIGMGIMKDDKGNFSDVFFNDGEELETVEVKEDQIKVKKDDKSGWLTYQQVEHYLEKK